MNEKDFRTCQELFRIATKVLIVEDDPYAGINPKVVAVLKAYIPKAPVNTQKSVEDQGVWLNFNYKLPVDVTRKLRESGLVTVLKHNVGPYVSSLHISLAEV